MRISSGAHDSTRAVFKIRLISAMAIEKLATAMANQAKGRDQGLMLRMGTGYRDLADGQAVGSTSLVPVTASKRRVKLGHALGGPRDNPAMPWNERAPQDRATAQLIIAGGMMALAVGAWVVAAALLGGDPWEPTRGGIPAILLGPVIVVFGVGVVWRGIKMHRSDKSPRR